MRPSADERDRGYLDDILEWCAQIRDLLRNKKFVDYVAQPPLRAATERWIELIGEASKSLSQEFKDSVPEVRWDQVVGMRDFLVHQYAKIDDLVVWDTAQKSIPNMVKILKLRAFRR